MCTLQCWKTLTPFIIAVFLVQAEGQEMHIFGTVVDSADQQALVAATIQVAGRGTLTDLDGRFNLTLSEVEDSVLLEIRYLGYHPMSVRLLRQATLDLGTIRMVAVGRMMDAVTVTAGKFEKPLSESTVSIEILQPALLDANNATSIDDVLDKVPGVAIIDGQANIRGGSGFSYGAGSRVMLLLDDIPALQADAGFPTWDDFPVENIAQLEVVKGATSALYGSSALNGIINVRTGYATEDPETKVSMFTRGFFAPRDRQKQWWSGIPINYGFSLRDARRLDKVDLVSSLYHQSGDDFQFENYDRHRRFTSKIRYRPTQRWEIGAQLNINDGEGQNFFFWKNAQEGAYQGDSSNYSTSDFFRYFLDPYIRYFTDDGDRHELKARVFHVDNMNNANRSNQSKLYYGEYQHINRIGSLDGIITLGIVGTHTQVTAALYSDTTFSTDNLAAYLQMEKKWGGRFTLNAGLRYETNILHGPTRVGSERIPEGVLRESKPVFRFGANYRLAEATYLRASWGEGYRYPTIAERYISTSFGSTIVSPNLQLESETGWSAELGVKQGFEWGEMQGFADLSLYWSEYQQMMEFVFTGLIEGFQSQNIGDTRIRGLDFSLNSAGRIWGQEATVIAGYTFVDPRFQDFTQRDSFASSVDYNILKYRSKHQFKIDVQAGGADLELGVSVQHTSEMEAVDAIFEFFVPGLQEFRRTHKGYTVTDMRAIYHLGPKLSATLLMRNLFNVEYSVRPGLLDAPRNLTLRLDWEL